MTWELEADLVDAIAQALLTDPGRGPGAQAGRILNRVAALGWMENWLLDDLLHASDQRLVTGMGGVDVEAIASAVDLRPASVTQRPRVGTTGVMMLDARSTYDSASLLILLEDMGFAIDPRPLVNAIKPSIPKRGLITASQLDVLWYDVRRLARTVEFRAPGPVRTREIEDRKLSTGHKVEIHRDAEDRAVALTIRGPRYRRRAEPVETTCADCGYVWYRGDPDSSAGHRREHKKRMVFLDPTPDPRVLEAREAEPEPELVTYASAPWKHLAMDERAVIFRREMHYSFVGWGVRYERDLDAQGYLFTSPEGGIVGACAFRWRDYTDAKPRWALQWIWVCPKARRTGVVRSRWPLFRQRYGDFVIEPPVSDAMRAFITGMGDQALLEPSPD